MNGNFQHSTLNTERATGGAGFASPQRGFSRCDSIQSNARPHAGRLLREEGELCCRVENGPALTLVRPLLGKRGEFIRAESLRARRFNPARSFLILLVQIYRWTLSPAKVFIFGPLAGCRFTPSCSQYALEAIRTHGALAGSWMALKRICRCHPWGGCGDDPVPSGKFQVPSSGFQVSAPRITDNNSRITVPTSSGHSH